MPEELNLVISSNILKENETKKFAEFGRYVPLRSCVMHPNSEVKPLKSISAKLLKFEAQYNSIS